MMELQTVWGWLVAMDLFLGGLGACAFCAAALIALATGERFKTTVRFGAWASAVSMALGTVALLLDVGKPLRALILFKGFVNFNSWMTRGAWLLFGTILLDGLFALFWTDRVLAWFGSLWKPLEEKRSVWRAILAIIGIPVNLGVAVYTGMLLGVLPFRPFWYTWFVPALFVASALYTGVGLVTTYATLWERGKGVALLRKVLEAFVVVLILVEGAVLWYYLQTMLSGSPDVVRSAEVLTGGALSLVFWIIVVGLGLAVPLLVCLIQLSGLAKRVTVVMSLVGIVSCLAGGWTLRFVVLSAGLPASLSSPALMQIFEGIRFIP